MKAFVHKILIPALLAATLLLAVRFLLFMHLRIPRDCQVDGYRSGQHVGVNLLAYGLRVPGERLWGYHRWGYAQPAEGERLVCRYVGSGTLFLATCRALPLDTVWIDPVRQRILPARTSPDACPIVMPRAGRSVTVTHANARLLAYLLQAFEHGHARADASGRLVLDGRVLRSVRFTTDYYWVETSRDSFLIVPHEALVGRAVSLGK